MLRFIIKLSLIFIFAFSALSIASRALGTTQPPNPALAGFTEGCEGKPQPCWYGIVPGTTTMEEAETLLTRIGYARSRVFTNPPQLNMIGAMAHMPTCLSVMFSGNEPHALVISLMLGCWHVDVGALVLILGSVAGVGGGYGTGDAFLVYTNDDGASIIRVFSKEQFFSISSEVSYVELVQPQQLHENLVRWHGFAPKWRYCELEPQYNLCI